MTPRLLLPATLIWGSLLPVVCAQQTQNQVVSPSLVAQSERTVVRSQEDLIKARSLMKKAVAMRADKNLRQSYLLACESLSLAPTGTASSGTRGSLVSTYTAIALDYARELINDGVFTDSVASRNGIIDDKGQPLSAEGVLKSILLPSVNPGCLSAKRMLSDLEQPEVFNKTVTPKFAAKRDEVVRLLADAAGYAQSGRNDLALRTYDAVLLIDPYNNAARKGMEAIHNTVIKYDDQAYNETRGRLLWQVDKAWERPPRKTNHGRTTESTGHQQETRRTDQIIERLNSIVLDRIDLNDSPLSEAVEYLKQKSVTMDPQKKGVNIFLKLTQAEPPPSGAQPPGGGTAPQEPAQQMAEPHVSLSLNHVPLYVALDYIAKLSTMKLKIDPFAVSIVPLSEPTDVMITKEYKVPPNFIPQKSQDQSGALPQAGQAGFLGGVPDPNKVRVGQKQEAKDYLASQGVGFPPGASANYLPAGSKLVVRNTQDNIDQIDALVDAVLGVAPSQVDIQTKFLEINQNNLQALGFDWLLGPFSIGGGVYGTGGGNGTNLSSSYYPFGNPMAGGAVMNPVGGLRSGDQIIKGDSINSLIAGQLGISTAPTPGIFSIAGIFSEPQFQLIIRALNQKKGVDLMSAPKVTTKSGVKATVKIVDEFIYPTQFTPPQLPNNVSNSSVGNSGFFIPPTVAPSFPAAFTKQDLGVVLDAKPTIGPDGYTIDMELNPRVVDFDGFINYGSPINAVGYKRELISGDIVETPVPLVITSNTINQPVFTFREVNTYVTVWDGQTVALGGLIQETIRKGTDKVPFLGDLPVAGRLFRSEADQKIKKNLVIFVTPRILDADGQPRREDVEEPEIVKPLGLPADLTPPSPSSPVTGGK